MACGETRIGISGWRYTPWRGIFYPVGLPQRLELEYASRQVNTIEINGTFYSLQSPDSFKAWHEMAPEAFLFAVKGSRFITHMKRLKDVRQPLATFFAQGLLALGKKLGPILWQFPPQFAFDRGKFESFFELLPRDTAAAARLARDHGDVMRFGSDFRLRSRQPIRYAVEIRHETFRTPEFIQLLLRHNIGLVVADTAGRWPFMEDVTSDFVYARLHGDKELYVSGYTPDSLDEWARKLDTWRRGKNPTNVRLTDRPMKSNPNGRDVFVYFDNDVKVHAPFDAINLAKRLAGKPKKDYVATPTYDPARVLPGPRERWPGMRAEKDSTRKKQDASRHGPSRSRA